MGSDPNGTGGLSVTLKQDGKDGAWIVFHGSIERITEDLSAAFNLDPTQYASFADLSLEASRNYKALGSAIHSLGARTTRSTPNPGSSSPAWEEARQGSEQAAPAEPEAPARNPLYDQLEALTNLEDHRQLWAKNRSSFDADAELLEAWKTKGRALKAA